MTMSLDNTRYIFPQFIFPFLFYKSFTVFDSKYKVEIALCVGIGHWIKDFNISVRCTLQNNTNLFFYKDYGALHLSYVIKNLIPVEKRQSRVAAVAEEFSKWRTQVQSTGILII